MNRLFAILFLTVLTSFVYAQTPNDRNTQGIDFGNKNKYGDAISEFDKAISEYDRSSAITYHNKAWAQELNGDVYGAISNYEEAFRRNPKQTLSAERLGYLYYQTGNYVRAVAMGEAVLYSEPANASVRKWLPDAYVKKLDQEKGLRLSGKDPNGGDGISDQTGRDLRGDATPNQNGRDQRKENDFSNQARDIQDRERHQPPAKKIILEAGFDFMLRYGYFYEDSKFKTLKTTGLLVDMPETMWVHFTPIDTWKFSLITGNPRLGSMAPNLLTHQERLESLYHMESISIGLGFLFSHHNSVINNGDKYKVNDFKTGFLFSYRTTSWDMDIKFYPRLLPRDSNLNNGKTMDVDSFDIGWTIHPNYYSKYYSLFSFKDFYFFDHDSRRSNWFGIYDIGLGAVIGSLNPLAFTIEYRQRFYMRNFENHDPYSLVPNGQGWFGLNFRKWSKGSPTSGVHAVGSEFTLKVEEKISSYVVLYQAFITEVGLKNEYGIETSFQIGVKGMF